PTGEVDGSLATLERAEFIHGETETEYVFRHPLTQEVAYGSQLLERRVALHSAVARALEEVFADRLGERAALIAHHWEQARRPGQATRWRRLAALRVARIQPRRSPRRCRRISPIFRSRRWCIVQRAESVPGRATMEGGVAAVGPRGGGGVRLGRPRRPREIHEGAGVDAGAAAGLALLRHRRGDLLRYRHGLGRAEADQPARRRDARHLRPGPGGLVSD